MEAPGGAKKPGGAKEEERAMKKTVKPKSAKGMKDLRTRAVPPRDAKGIRGGTAPSEFKIVKLIDKASPK